MSGSMRGAAWIRTDWRPCCGNCGSRTGRSWRSSACSCSTPIGAFDPLAGHCRRVPAPRRVAARGCRAWGQRLRESRGIATWWTGLDRADSVVWDAHKMLFMPALCAFVFFRDKAHRFEAFRQEAPYLFDPAAPGLAEFDSGLRTVECTKRAAAFGLWGVWALYGQQLFADLVDVTFSLGHECSTKSCWRHPTSNRCTNRNATSSCSATCPRSWPTLPPEQLGRFQLELRRRVIESGEFYIVSTKIDGIGALRTTIINPLTTPEHLDQLLDSIRRHGRELLASRIPRRRADVLRCAREQAGGRHYSATRAKRNASEKTPSRLKYFRNRASR